MAILPNSLRIRVDDPNNPTPDNFGDDLILTYTFSNTNHQLTYKNGVTTETLSSRIVNNPDIDGDGISEPMFSFSSSGSEVIITLTARYNPNLPVDSNSNPEVSLQSQVFFGEHSFN